MTPFRLRSLFALATVSLAACLDVTPSVVTKVTDDASKRTTDACLACLTAPTTPANGCVAELADCLKVPLCQRGVECTFQQGCYNLDGEPRALCIRYCADLVGFMTTDSPETRSAFVWYNCAINNCQTECVGGDGGLPEAGTPDGGAPDSGPADAPGDAPGAACQNPDDQAVQASSAFAPAPRDCGFMCFGMPDPNCAAQCMQSKGLTEGCSKCWGDTINCGSKYCIGECLEQTSAGCLACNAMYCDSAFHACSGN